MTAAAEAEGQPTMGKEGRYARARPSSLPLNEHERAAAASAATAAMAIIIIIVLQQCRPSTVTPPEAVDVHDMTAAIFWDIRSINPLPICPKFI